MTLSLLCLTTSLTLVAEPEAAVEPAAADEPAIEVVADGPVSVPRGSPVISNQAYEVWLGALLETQVRTGADAAFDLPRARLRAAALVEKQIPAGMVLEVEASPFADPADNLHGPGALRDAYLHVGIGNRRVLDLGEVQVGQLRVPTTANSLQPPERWRFSHRPLAETLLLPGRDIGFVYHIDYGAHGVPLRLWIGNFTGAGPNLQRARLSPGLSLRAESALWSSPDHALALRAGLGVLYDSGGGEHPTIVVGDLTARARRLSFEAAWIAAGPSMARLHERVGMRAEGGIELLADFLELRLRHEALNFLSGRLEHRSAAGVVMTYLDDAFQVLFDVTVPSRRTLETQGSAAVLTLRMWW